MNNRDLDFKYMFYALVNELKDEDILWRTMSKTYTVGDMKKELADNSDVGKQYVSEVLRVTRDLIKRGVRIKNEKTDT